MTIFMKIKGGKAFIRSAVIFLFYLVLVSFPFQENNDTNLIKEEVSDLNGDVKKEMVKLYAPGEPECTKSDFLLQVNELMYRGSLIDCVD